MLHRGCYCPWYNLRFWNSVKFTIEFLLSSILCCHKVRPHDVDQIKSISRSWDDLPLRRMWPISIALLIYRARCTLVTNLGVSVRFILHSDNKESFCRSILCCTQDFLWLLWERSDALLFTWHTAGFTTTIAYRRYTISDFCQSSDNKIHLTFLGRSILCCSTDSFLVPWVFYDASGLLAQMFTASIAMAPTVVSLYSGLLFKSFIETDKI